MKESTIDISILDSFLVMAFEFTNFSLALFFAFEDT